MRKLAVAHVLGLFVLVIAFGEALAQTPGGDPSDAAKSEPPDPSATDPGDEPGEDRWYDFLRFGGGSTVGGQLDEDAKVRPPLVPVPVLDEQLARYRAWKARVARRTGLEFGTDYALLYQAATESRGPSDAASGVWRVFGRWDLLARDTENTGSLVFRVENRHGLRTEITPAELGDVIGSVLPTAVGYSDAGWLLNTLYWVQRIKGRATLSGGQLDPTDFVDPSGLLNRLTAFTGEAFAAANPTIAVPDAGIGASVAATFRDRFYAMAAFTDANGDPTHPFREAFSDGEFFSTIQLGVYSHAEHLDLKNLHVMAWHVDARERVGTPEGWGVSASGTWAFDDRWAPFLRLGYSQGGAARLEGLVAGGLGVQIRGGDLLGIGLYWGRPSDSALRDQYGAEVFYRLQLVGNLAVTPDFQLVIDPARRLGAGVIAVFGIRGRLVF